MKYSFIAQHKKTWPVDVMCRLMGISRYSYYSYQRRHENLLEDPERQEMLEWIKKVSEASLIGSCILEKPAVLWVLSLLKLIY